jgi:formylglycine-generating enzyme required for sulfatase activity
MSSERVLNRFLKLYLGDQASGKRRSLAEYQSLVPGHDDVVAQEYARYEREAGGSGRAAPPIPYIGRFRVVEELGRGGQGVVYLAEDEQLHRNVAVKVLTGLGSLTPDRIARFLREAEVASRLAHPGIATVYEVGMDAGMPFIAMRYVEGESLAARISSARSGRTPPAAPSVELSMTSAKPEALAAPSQPAAFTGPATPAEIGRLLAIFEDVARTLHFAHEAGIVHRDIKPGNLIVAKDGTPVILDFGVAQDLDADQPTLTATGDLMGTPAYMSPEQVAGQRVRLDRRTDVYSLGVSLYECLTLVRPFDAPTREALYQAILAKDPPDARRINHAVPRDLRVVLESAIEKDRDRRYQTALDFAEDLRRVRVHEPVRARPVGKLVRLGRWAQRNPALALALGGLFAVLVAGLVTALVLLDESERERTMKVRALDAVTAERDGKNAALADYERLSDLTRHLRLLGTEKSLWPAVPEKVEAMRDWVAQAEDLAKRLPEHVAALERLRRSSLPEDSSGSGPASRPWRFHSVADQFKHDTTQALVQALTEFDKPPRGSLAAMRRRLERAESVVRETIDKYAPQWEAAIASIADPASCPRYRGLRIKPQVGLIPIGRDPESGLWEFVHLHSVREGTSPIPKRDQGGRVVFEEPMGVVLVLIPGGTFTMGAVPPDEEDTPNQGNRDLDARPEESPLHEVTLDPFFLSKYEVTQGQWLRTTGKSPSQVCIGLVFHGHTVDARHPVERVSWEECNLWAERHDLVLPTEAQWEYAARAGTTTPYWTGAGGEELARAGNLLDATSRDHGGGPGLVYEPWSDGWAAHAPVGSLAPNPFGLHDVIGNVWEYCRDDYRAKYDTKVLPGDGLHEVPGVADIPRLGGSVHHPARGGSFHNAASNGRSARRSSMVASLASADSGFRPARPIR